MENMSVQVWTLCQNHNISENTKRSCILIKTSHRQLKIINSIGILYYFNRFLVDPFIVRIKWVHSNNWIERADGRRMSRSFF